MTISGGIFSPLANNDSLPMNQRSKSSMPISPLYNTNHVGNKSGLNQAWGTPSVPDFNYTAVSNIYVQSNLTLE